MQHALDVREPQDCSNKVFNSIIECENQILGEELGVVGTAFTLNYRSSRSAGYVDGRSFTVPLIGDTVPSGLIRIELTVDVAGRHFNQAFSPDTNQSHTFTWDGLDAYGRPMRGEQQALVVLDYIYERLYAVPDTIVASGQFALSCRGSAGAGWSVCILTDTAAASTPRREYRVGSGQLVRLGNWNASEYGLGGWTLDAQHAYNPVSRVLHYGDGSRRSFALDQPIVTNLGGTSGGGYAGDGGQAASASFDDPQGLAIAPDGSIYVADTDNDRVRRIAPDGVVTTVAGTGTEGFSGDGGPATAAQLTQPVSVAITPDGGFLVGDGVRLRRVDASGTITTIAGNGSFGLSGDGGPADSAASRGFYRLRVAPDGTIYFVDGSVFTLNVVRRIGPDGIINRVVDNVTCDSVCGDGGPALQAGFFNMPGLALANDGSLYISDGNHVFRHVDPAGRITRVAGV
jgi:hypothetical protein